MIAWIAAAVSITGIVLNARKNVLCWPVWLFSNGLWGAYYYATGQPAPLILVAVFVFGNVYGWVKWTRP